MNPSVGIATVTLHPAIDHSVLIRGFASGRLNRVLSEQCDPGGKGVNVASFLADLRLRVTATGLLGRENAGVFEQLFAERGITDAFVRIPGKTRVNIKILDETAAEGTEINFPGPAASADCLAALTRAFDALLPDHDCFILSGSVPAGVPAAFCPDLIRRLKVAGKRVLLDSSGDALRHGIAAGPWAIKPNLAELEELVGEPLRDEPTVIRAARARSAQHARCWLPAWAAWWCRWGRKARCSSPLRNACRPPLPRCRCTARSAPVMPWWRALSPAACAAGA
ncbi:MAG: Tagatose-6-phosphate kinase [Candidatus Accumulibacter sp. BA-94]|nr:MAG: Tagatose-6-phosphate kinase [Candidatus Accumulibacter sp. BA-94]